VPFVETQDNVTMQEVFFLILLGLLAGAGHWCLTVAFQRAPASLLAPFTYLHMIWATCYGFFLFGQLPDAISGLGMAVIVLSGIGLMFHERRYSRVS